MLADEEEAIPRRRAALLYKLVSLMVTAEQRQAGQRLTIKSNIACFMKDKARPNLTFCCSGSPVSKFWPNRGNFY